MENFNKIWKVNTENKDLITMYAESLDISYILASILVDHGFDYQTSERLIKKNYELINAPSILTNAKKAAKQICNAMKKNYAIKIYADYDVDGLTSGYVGASALLDCKEDLDIEVYYPDRSEGYGINMGWCKELVKNKKDENILVITVDNGITRVDEVQYLLDNNIEVIVTDHHESKNIVPNCTIVNPHNKTEKQDKRTLGLSGCGVIFKVVQIVQSLYGGEITMLNYTPYVALSIVADVMPMTLENIALVNYGLSIINSDNCPMNIKNFLEYNNKNRISARNMSFDIIPKLNSCGRMNCIDLAGDYLFEKDPEKSMDKLIDILKVDKERSKIADKALKEASELINEDDSIIVLKLTSYPVGILGIIANKIVDKYKRPAIILKESGDYLTGSARSTNNIDLLKTTYITKENLKEASIDCAGHKAAFGLSLKKEYKDEFKNELIKQIVFDDDSKEEILNITSIIKIKDINMDLKKELDLLPFNNYDLQMPLLMLENISVRKYNLSRNNPENIKLSLKDDTGMLDIWAWGFGSYYEDELGKAKKIDIVGQLEENFMNPNFATLRIIDIKESA